MPFSCTTCKTEHPTEHVCEKPKVNDCCKLYTEDLIKVFDKFTVGYGSEYQVHFLALRRRLFDPETIYSK